MSRKYGISILAAAGVFVIVDLVDELLARAGLRADATYLDNTLLAIAVGALVLILERQHERRLMAERNRLAIVAQMNHHVRNALQLIICSTHLPDSKELMDIQNAVDRIDWALREILPSIGVNKTNADQQALQTPSAIPVQDVKVPREQRGR